MKSLIEIQSEVEKLAELLPDFETRYLPTYGSSEDGARPHIEINEGQYHWVVVERGQEIQRKSSTSFDNLLYWIFKSSTFIAASKFELCNRIEGQDPRRLLWNKQLEMLRILNPSWAERRSIQIERVLVNGPFRDNP